MTRIEQFREAYLRELSKDVIKFPLEYGYDVENVPSVVEKMIRAILAGSYNNSNAIKRAAKSLGLPTTQRDLPNALRKED